MTDNTMEYRIGLEKQNKRNDQVTELILDNCRASQISGLTEEFVNLESLSLINVGLVTLKGFPKLPKLKKLELSDNRLTGGLEFLHGSPKLQHLNISGNRVKELEALEPLKEFHDLVNLDLCNCEVTKSDDYRKKVFDLLPNLHSLDGFDINEREVNESDESDDEDDGEDDDEDSVVENRKTCEGNGKFYYLAIVTLLILVAVLLKPLERKPLEPPPPIRYNLEQVNELETKFPGLISPKEMRIIKTRLAVMGREVSILMLLGKSRDSFCLEDPTFCVGQTIANVTQMQFGYIDASNSQIISKEIQRELNSSLAGDRYTVMVDSLEKLPGTEVMSLFQFIDKDQFQSHSRGLLIFVVYTGANNVYEDKRMREAEIAEKILFEKWSPFIPKDSLTSIISRICSSIIKIY